MFINESNVCVGWYVGVESQLFNISFKNLGSFNTFHNPSPPPLPPPQKNPMTCPDLPVWKITKIPNLHLFIMYILKSSLFYLLVTKNTYSN